MNRLGTFFLKSMSRGSISRSNVIPVFVQCRDMTNSSFMRRHERGRFKPSKQVKPPEVEDNRPIEEVARSIDTTLTPRQRIHVEALKRSYKGGPKSPRSIYRDVPTLDEIKKENSDLNYSPKMAENAEELIDWALSHIPERTGARKSRAKKRAANRQKDQRIEHASRIQGNYLARKRKRKKMEKHKELARKYHLEAIRLYGDNSASSPPLVSSS